MWSWICQGSEYVTLAHCACSNPPVFPQYHLFSPSGQHLFFSALQFLLQKDLLHTASLSSSNSSVTQGLGSSGFREQRRQELLSFRWKLRWCSQSSKMLVSCFVVWQPMGRSCSTLLAEPCRAEELHKWRGEYLPLTLVLVQETDRLGGTLCFRNRQKGPMEVAPEDPRQYPYPNPKPVVSAFAGYHLRKRKHPRIHSSPTPRPPHGCRSAGI